MNFCTKEQFDKYFLPHLSGKVGAYNSPQLEYMCSKNNIATNRDDSNCDVVIVDAPDGIKCPGAKNAHERHWMHDPIKHLKDGGKLVARLTKRCCNYVADLDCFNPDKIIMMNNEVVIIGTKTSKVTDTVIVYPECTITQNVKKVPVLSYYDKEHLDYLNRVTDVDTHVFQRITIAGRNNAFEAKTSGYSLENALFFTHFSSAPVLNTIDDVKKTLSTDMFIFKSPEERDVYVSLQNNQKVMKLISNLCYNVTTSFKVEHKHLIINPAILSL